MIRLFLLFVSLIALSSALPRWFPPGWGGPDLFLLVAVMGLSRRSPIQALPLAYALGLVQDLLGYGHLGLHAAGVMAAVYAAHHMDRRLPAVGGWRGWACILAATCAQGLTFAALALVLQLPILTFETLAGILPFQTLWILVFYIPIQWVFKRFWGSRFDLMERWI